MSNSVDLKISTQLISFDSIPLNRFGNDLMIAGAIYSDGREDYYIKFPEEGFLFPPYIVEADSEQWKALLAQTDRMETEILAKAADGSFTKAVMRKSQRQIDQSISWKVYRRDNYSCRYCGKDDLPLTVDHLITWEAAGPSIEENLVSCCKRCNKARGNTEFKEWLESADYRKFSKGLSDETRTLNEIASWNLHKIPLKHHVISR